MWLDPTEEIDYVFLAETGDWILIKPITDAPF
jgi:hypothetical protein